MDSERKNGTADAIHCVRRIVDKGESTNTKTLMVLIDWEKAFDKVDQQGLFIALERVNMSQKIVNLIKAMYANPQFKVSVEDNTSGWYLLETGIRQGCPLSPYLFVILMSVMFHDIHAESNGSVEEERVKGADFDEVLYADDTICISQSERAMNLLLESIETEGAHYGMKINKK